MTQITQDGEKRIITLEEGVTLELDMGEYERQREAKYGRELMNEASLKPEDTAETYQERLLLLYPHPEQQAYIKAMFTISQAGVFGMYAMQSYALNEQRVPEVEELYPEALNQDLQGKGGQAGYTDIPVQMSRSKANDVIIAANQASFQIKQAEKKIVEGHKSAIKRVISGEQPLESAPFDSQLKLRVAQLQLQIASRLVGQQVLDQVVTRELDGLVTPQYLELFTPEVSRKLSEIAGYITEPFNPIHMFVDTIECRLALDNLNIYVPDSTVFDKVYSRVINKTRPGWSND